MLYPSCVIVSVLKHGYFIRAANFYQYTVSFYINKTLFKIKQYLTLGML